MRLSKGESYIMKLVKVLMVSLLCLALCFGCGKKEDKAPENAGTSSEELKETNNTEANPADSEMEEDIRPDNEIIAEAMEKTSKLASFKAVVEGNLKLGGKTINGEFGMESQIQVVQGEDRKNLQMTMETRINPGTTVSKAYYKDGCYYMDDGQNREKLSKSPEEVLGIITDITDMVTKASDKLENISVKEDGADKIYSYELPSYIAEDYIAKLMTEMGAEDTILDNASAEVESLKLVSTVSAEGILTRQEVLAAGKIKRAIVSVPVEAQITAEFAETDEKELKMELW